MALTETIKTYGGGNFDNPLIKQKTIDISPVGVINLVSAVAGKQIQILELVMSVDTSGTYTLQSDADTIFIFLMVAAAGLIRQSSADKRPLFCATEGAALNLSSPGSATVATCYIQWLER